MLGTGKVFWQGHMGWKFITRARVLIKQQWEQQKILTCQENNKDQESIIHQITRGEELAAKNNRFNKKKNNINKKYMNKKNKKKLNRHQITGGNEQAANNKNK